MKEVDKIIFLHVPKTAGTTISAQLINSFHENEIHRAKSNLEDLEKQIKNKKLIIGHSTLKYFSKIKNLDEFLIFTVLRDPIESAISWSLHALRLKRNNKNHSVLFLPYKNILPYIYYNLDKIDWGELSDNQNAIHLLEANLDGTSWYLLSRNPKAINILKNHQDNINWEMLLSNPSIFEPDKKLINENILNKTQNSLKLKRNKPVTNPNNTLQSFMDLKII